MNPTRPTVVMVDDEKPLLDFLAGMLKQNLGWQVCTFNRPRAALAALPAIEAGVLVTDYCMPELNGFELIEAARQLKPGLPCLMISGHPLEVATDRQVSRSNPCTILAKPFGWQELARIIAQHAPEFAPDEPQQAAVV